MRQKHFAPTSWIFRA